MTDDLTPPHWGSNEVMANEEIDTLIERLETSGDVPCSVIVDAIAALRALIATPPTPSDPVKEAAKVLLAYSGDYMPDVPRLAAVRAVLERKGSTQPANISVAWFASLRALAGDADKGGM